MPLAVKKEEKELADLCGSVKKLALNGDLAGCERLVAEAMGRHPHAPQPHNLMGVLLEMKNEHSAAMKHFKAAWSLDPTYYPARHNLDNFASFYINGKYAFDENDCPARKNNAHQLEYDMQNIGRAIKEE